MLCIVDQFGQPAVGGDEAQNDQWVDPEYNDDERQVVEDVVAQLTNPPQSYYPTERFPELPYRVQHRRLRMNYHVGQRKLFLAEMRFMVETISDFTENIIFVYAGAAAGIHTAYLSSLFPSVQFHLYDPAPFDKNLIEYSKKYPNRVHIYNDYFTDEVATHWGNVGCDLFMSDIRLSNETGPTEQQVHDDMEMQQRWVELCNPRIAASLKFRPPYTETGREGRTVIEEQSYYLQGEIMLQIWAPRSSTEARLIVKPPFTRAPFNHIRYENYMFYFNTFVREWGYFPLYKRLGKLVKGYDNCADCFNEVTVWKKYLGKNATDKVIAKHMNELSAAIHRQFVARGEWHGQLPDKPIRLRRKHFYNEMVEHNLYPTDKVI